VQALDAGALGYASKDQSMQELTEAIHTVAQGARYLAPRISRAVLVKYMGGGHRETPRGATPLGTLTVREKEIFELAVRGLSNDAIAGRLGISRRTVETHRGRILTKLHMHSAAELARFAARHGLLEG
jgi:DNA-binding NarL/FixJ family response regulator